jgi:hypothetical protein
MASVASGYLVMIFVDLTSSYECYDDKSMLLVGSMMSFIWKLIYVYMYAGCLHLYMVLLITYIISVNLEMFMVIALIGNVTLF